MVKFSHSYLLTINIIVFLIYFFLFDQVKLIVTCPHDSLLYNCMLPRELKFIMSVFGLVYWSSMSLCHSNGHIETMPAREINPFTALTRIRSQFLRTQWSYFN